MKSWALVGLLAFASMLCWGNAATAATPATYALRGIEISQGIIIDDTRFGATFVGATQGIAGSALGTTGTWSVSVNYNNPPSPGPNVRNHIVGGFWSLTVYKNNRVLGSVWGTVVGGETEWNDAGTKANVTANLQIQGGSGIFRGSSGIAVFGPTGSPGTLSHQTFPPTISGPLVLPF